MDNISLVISGNLTGFTRFYATPSAIDVLKNVKFDLDYRNPILPYLNSGEKAYAISFGPSVLAVSLISLLLDSFRRPGILVVTLLLPRKTKVESATSQQNKYALYQLLNEVNDKFYEKNFINGMLNQNAAVLIQDYYSEILSRYVLVPDGMQRGINLTIAVDSFVKRAGYVKTSEDDVPLFLYSPCRRSYEGYHNIFLTQHPTQNIISEAPEEVVLYKVRITNTNQVLSNVTLNDRIYNLQPEEGEVDVNKNYTYRQVLNGESGRDIVAKMSGETIDITYRFEKEKKAIRFIFKEGGKEIPFATVLPTYECNGTVCNIPSETYTFEGREIYSIIRLSSRNDNYRIKPGNETISLRRLQDMCVVSVEQCFHICIHFNVPDDKPKRIVLRSEHGKFPFENVTNSLEGTLPGRVEDYTYTVESSHYETVSGRLTANQHITLKKKSPQPIIKRDDAPVRGDHTTQIITLRSDVISSTDNERDKDPEPKPKRPWHKYCLLACMVLAIGIVSVTIYKKLVKPSPNQPIQQLAPEEVPFERIVRVCYKDAGDEIIREQRKGINFDVFAKYIKLKIDPKESCELIREDRNGEYAWFYRLSGNANDVDEFSFTAYFDYFAVSDAVSVDSDSLLNGASDTIPISIQLTIMRSQIKLYDDLLRLRDDGKPIKTETRTQYNEKIEKVNHKEYKNMLKNLLSQIPSTRPTTAPGLEGGTTGTEKPTLSQYSLPQEVKEKIKQPEKVADVAVLKSLKNTTISATIIKYDSTPLEVHTAKDIIDYYNNWLSKVYNHKDDEEKNTIKDELEKCTTYQALVNVLNRYRGTGDKQTKNE